MTEKRSRLFVYLHLLLPISLALVSETSFASSEDTLKFRNIDSAVVTVTKSVTNRRLVPNTITVVPSVRLEASANSALLPVVSREVPGLFVTQKGVTGFGVSEGSAGVVNIRGVGQGNKVLLMLDGQPQWAGIFGHALPDLYVASDADRVEVLRGPGSLIYGSNAAGGIINVITHSQDSPGRETRARFMYGSYNTQKYLVSNGWTKGKFSSFVSVNHDRTDGHRDNSAFRITNGFAKSSWKFNNKLRLVADLSLARTKGQNPGRVDKPIYDNTIDILRGSASVALENNTGNLSGMVKAYYGFGDHLINDGYFAGGTPRNTLFSSFDHNMGVMLYESFSLFRGNRVTLGADWKNWGGKASNVPVPESSMTAAQIVDKSVSELAAYAIVQQELFNLLTLNGGVRYENNSVFGGEWIPQIGATLRPFTGNTVKFILSKGFRSPNIREMYMFPPQNPDLKPERILNRELSLIQEIAEGRFTAELALFLITGDNLIQVAMVDGRPVNSNTGEFTNKGFEFETRARILSNLVLSGNYSYLHTDKPMLAAPEHMFNMSAVYAPGAFSFTAGIQYTGGLYVSLQPNPVTEENYMLVNASASWDHKFGNIATTLFLRGDNLAGTHYSINYGFPMPGRVISAGINFNF
jgi:iron complex outermembrane receptor protein